MLLLHFKSCFVPISIYERCRTSQTSVAPSFLIAVIFISQIAFQVWELYWGIRRVNRHSRLVWIPACAEANSLHYSAQFATCPRLGKSPERPLNLLHCIQRLELCCTCQNGQTQLINTLPTSDIPTENTPSLATSSSALGLKGWQFPDLRELRRSRCLAQAAPAKVLLFCSSEQACLIHDPPSDICHFGSAANAAAVNQDSAVRGFLKSGAFPDKRQSFILHLISSFCAKHKLSTDLKPGPEL